MTELYRCPQCGSELPVGALPGGLCSRCLPQLGLTSEASSESDSGIELLTRKATEHRAAVPPVPNPSVAGRRRHGHGVSGRTRPTHPAQSRA